MELTCPKDGGPLVEAGGTHRCKTCDGAWIPEATLVGILEQRTAALVALSWSPRETDQARPCAECKQPMQMVNLGNVELDRCADHGVWFDANELTMLLRQSKRFKTAPPDADAGDPNVHHGLLASLRKLFAKT
jgi:Zn-finger nucleic acid-binding protein